MNISRISGIRPATASRPGQRPPNQPPNPAEDKQTGMIIRIIDFEDKLMKYISGVFQSQMDKYLKERDKLGNNRGTTTGNFDELKKQLIVNIYNDIKKEYGENYDIEIVRTNGKMNYWGNNENAMFVSFGGQKSEDNTFLVMLNKKNK